MLRAASLADDCDSSSDDKWAQLAPVCVMRQHIGSAFEDHPRWPGDIEEINGDTVADAVHRIEGYARSFSGSRRRSFKPRSGDGTPARCRVRRRSATQDATLGASRAPEVAERSK